MSTQFTASIYQHLGAISFLSEAKCFQIFRRLIGLRLCKVFEGFGVPGRSHSRLPIRGMR